MDKLPLTIRQYQLLTDWYLSALDGIKDTDGDQPINGFTNSLEWIAGHLLSGRYSNIRQLGMQTETFQDLDKFVDATLPPPRNT